MEIYYVGIKYHHFKKKACISLESRAERNHPNKSFKIWKL